MIRDLPAVYISPNDRLFRITKGLQITSPTKKNKVGTATTLYILEEFSQRIWVPILFSTGTFDDVVNHLTATLRANVQGNDLDDSDLEDINKSIQDIEKGIRGLIKEMEGKNTVQTPKENNEKE